LKILYVVHDLHDAAVERRVRMLREARADVIIAGFRRRDTRPSQLLGFPVVDLGRTADARMLQRVGAVLGHCLRPAQLKALAADADVVIGRNLECLALAARIRTAAPDARLVYECLDIHRLLIETSLPARLIQKVQAALLRQTDLILTSSPAFVREYFAQRFPDLPPVHLIENKVLMLGTEGHGSPPELGQPAPAAPPWVIGWFGMLRCRRSFDILAELVKRSEGRVQVRIAGRPSPAVFDDFDALLRANPGFTFTGPYTADDLPSLYKACHFAWAIDFYEEGLNSDWLLPNRLYEAIANGSVPIGIAGVEIGRWLAERQVGLSVSDAEGGVLEALKTMSPQEYERLQAQVTALARNTVIADRSDCEALALALAGSLPDGMPA